MNDLIKPRKVIAIEINEGPCELARRVLSSLYDDVEVVCGDAFKVAWGIGLILLFLIRPSLGGNWFEIGMNY